jgi:UDP-N-acetylmuramate--alanine ligase
LGQTALLDKRRVKHVHFIGIGGIGLSAIARVLHADGYTVSGCDARMTPLTDELQRLGMTVHDGHDASHVQGADVIVVSSAVPAQNAEVVAARKAGIPVVKRASLLGEMMAGRCGIAVAGTHGKTTTSALLAFVLIEAGLDPTFIVGGLLQDLEVNAHLGAGAHFVIEADEYDNTFLGLRPHVAIVTAIEMDHPDCFSDTDDVTNAFRQFVHLVPEGGAVVGCFDQPPVVGLMQELRSEQRVEVIVYGLGEGPRALAGASHLWRAQAIEASELGGSHFLAVRDGQAAGRVTLALPGIHNIGNALAVLAVTDRLGVEMSQVLEALPRFHGVRRRFEVKGEAGGVVVVDDYAHHPTQIRATLAAARRRYAGRRLWAFFQPHTYSRTKSLLDEFASSFGEADRVLVSPIYGARETDDLGVSGQDLVKRISHAHARFVPSLEAAGDLLAAELEPGDVLLTLGAGDGNLVGEQVLDALRGRSAAYPSSALSGGAGPEGGAKHGT